MGAIFWRILLDEHRWSGEWIWRRWILPLDLNLIPAPSHTPSDPRPFLLSPYHPLHTLLPHHILFAHDQIVEADFGVAGNVNLCADDDEIAHDSVF